MTGLIETMRVVNGRAPLWPLHRTRLLAAAESLQLDITLPAAPTGDDRIVRYLVSASGGLEESARRWWAPPTLRLMVSPVPHPVYPWKTTARSPFDDALTLARGQGDDDGLLLSADGAVREASRWAVVWRRPDGSIGAPSLATGVLRSVARTRLEQILDGSIEEENLSVDALVERPVAALNAARGLISVATIGGRAVPDWCGWAALADRFWP